MMYMSAIISVKLSIKDVPTPNVIDSWPIKRIKSVTLSRTTTL